MSGTALATEDKKLFYCFVPKTGCTYWKRVLRFIGKDYRGRFKSPEEIPRMHAHFGPYINTKVIQLHNKSNLERLGNKFRFMFTRDPYERLWSGYLDKLYLPDFWWWLGTKIINATRPGANERSLQCGDDVTFEEFLLFTTNNLKTGDHVDIHFAPVYTQCNPCVIKFDVIGKLETFKEDTALVLEKANVSLVNNVRASARDIILEEIQTLIKYNFDILSRIKHTTQDLDCYNALSIAKRLWKTFQYHGYISDKHEFPFKDFEFVTDLAMMKTALVNRIVHLRKLAGTATETWTRQRQKYITVAYTSVSKEVFDAIGQTYKGDLELFGYKKRNWYNWAASYNNIQICNL